MNKKLLVVLAVLFLAGCTHLQSVSLTPIPKNRGKKVSAESDKLIFFAFNFNNDYVDRVVTSLKSKCAKGQIKGILTKDESVTYFPLIVHKRRITATGYCVK